MKVKKKTLKYSPALSILVIKDAQVMSSSLKVINGRKAVKPPLKSYAQIVVANAAQNPLEKAWTEVKSSSCKWKGTSSNILKVEPKKSLVIFWKRAIFSQRSEAHLIFVLNKLL